MVLTDTLNKKHAKFVVEYAVDYNATQAAIRAGYSKHSAHVQGCQLLKLPKIKAAVSLLEERVLTSANLRREDIIKMLIEQSQRRDDKSTHAGNVAALGLLARAHGLLNLGEQDHDETRKYNFVMHSNRDGSKTASVKSDTGNDTARKLAVVK